MASGAVAAAGGAASAAPSASASGGQNPFQIATNLYAEKNNQGVISSQLLSGTATIPNSFAVNSGNFLRQVRMIVRTVTAGVAGTLSADGLFNLFTQIDLVNVDGSEIMYNMGSYAYMLGQKYFRPWLQNPATMYDAAAATANSPAFTLPVMPEVRWAGGVLANTDTRSQYRIDSTIGTTAQIGTGYTTAPAISVTPYMDAWAQPDAQDLQGNANQPVPPGVNLQIKRRHQIFGLNPAGSNNVLLSTLTGNMIRGMILVLRDGNGARQDAFTDPIYWQQDNRSLGRLNLDIIRQWMADFYTDFNRGNTDRETGVYVFPRFMNPGDLYGQGWLATSNATKLQFEAATAAGITGNGTAELIADEVYPVGPIDPQLLEI